MTNTCFNTHKIDIYCKLGSFQEELQNKLKYSIKDCANMQYNLELAAALFDVICWQCIDDDDEESCCTDDDTLCKIIDYIKSLLKNCNCR